MADIDDGYTRLANELYDALIESDLSKNEQKVAHAICRCTYGFNKKVDRIADSQLAKRTKLSRQAVSFAKNTLIRMKVLVWEGSKIGPNKNLSDWDISECHRKSDTVRETMTESVRETTTPVSGKVGHTKDTIQKTRKTRDQNTSAEPAIADSTPVVIESVSAEPVSLPAKQPAPQEPVVITMPLNSGEHQVTESFAAQMQALYPAVDVAQELRTMTGWLIANPTKRKTKTGINRFINAWLSKCQDRGGSNGLQAFTPRRNDHTDLTQTMTATELNQRMQEGF